VVLTLCALVLLAWMSMLTYDPTDYGPAWRYPPGETQNAAGQVGAFVAHHARYWLGGGAYMALIFLTVAAGLLVTGGRVGEWPWRLVGTAMLVACTSTAIYLLRPDGAVTVANGSAGVLGHTLGQGVLDKFEVRGAWLIVLSVGFIGAMFAADKLVLSLPRLARRGAGRLVKAASGRWKSGQTASAPPMVRPTPVKPKLAKPPAPVAPAPKLPPDPAPAPAARRASSPAPTKDAALPSVDLLAEPEDGYMDAQQSVAADKQTILQQTLNDFNVQAEVAAFQTGPVITLFEVALAPGVKVSQVASLATDIARALVVPGVRIVPHLVGRDTIGIEVPNDDKEIVRLKDLMGLAPDAATDMHLPLFLGKDAGGEPIVADLSGMPHMLIAGTTGSGKSVCINAIITSLLLTRQPRDVRLILADPKMVEMAAFDGLPHLLCPIVNDMRRAEDILDWAATRMDERYDLLKEAGVRNIAGYNALSKADRFRRMGADAAEDQARIPERMDYIVIIIDELADLIMTSSKEVETYIIRIAQKARAVGIHLILATQRPSVNVVTGLIKSNMPCRISFQVASRQESRIVLDQNGAETLLGRGDMLLMQPGTSHVVRAQGTYVDESEIHRVVRELKSTVGQPQFNEDLVRINSGSLDAEGATGERDDIFNQAVEVVLAAQRGSVSLLQRRLQVGYGRASRIVDQMAEAGILGEYKGSQARECMMTLEDWETFQQSVAADQSGASAADGTPTSV